MPRVPAPPSGETEAPVRRLHVVYLAVIAVLVLVLVLVGGRAMRAHRLMKDVEEHMGLAAGVRAAIPRPEALRVLTRGELLRERSFDEYRAEVDEIVERATLLGEFGDKPALAAACARALAGGKRLRPIILMEISRAATLARASAEREKGRPPPPAVDPADAALCVECLHASSLVIDDLPEFDDDSTRRGAPSLHAETSPAIAQMAALSLLASAFHDICHQIDWIRDHCPEFRNVDRIGTRLCGEVTRAIGAMGAAGGQYLDACVAEEDLFHDHGPEAVEKIMRLKTATFFEIAFIGGWVFAGGAPERVPELRAAGRHFGLAFQVADDLGDMAQDAARQREGKPGKNYANHYGPEAAERTVAQNLNACRLMLDEFSLFTPLWREIYEKVWRMAERPQAEPKTIPTEQKEGQESQASNAKMTVTSLCTSDVQPSK